MNYKIAICDDNEIDAAYIAQLVHIWADNSRNTITIQSFPSAESFLFHYADEKDYDILLLDIEMKTINGVELAKQIRTENSTVQIVFITGFPDFIAEGYEVSALHYLMKPVSADKLSEVLDWAVDHLGKSEKSVIFNVNGEAVRISIGDIVFIEAFAHSCEVTTVNNKFKVKSSITELEKLVGKSFIGGSTLRVIRCHRSYLVGIKYIKSIRKAEITLDSEDKIPLSRSNYGSVYQAFIQYFKGEI